MLTYQVVLEGISNESFPGFSFPIGRSAEAPFPSAVLLRKEPEILVRLLWFRGTCAAGRIYHGATAMRLGVRRRVAGSSDCAGVIYKTNLTHPHAPVVQRIEQGIPNP